MTDVLFPLLLLTGAIYVIRRPKKSSPLIETIRPRRKGYYSEYRDISAIHSSEKKIASVETHNGSHGMPIHEITTTNGATYSVRYLPEKI